MSGLSARLYVAQRLSALVMAPLVLGHIAVMVIAIQGGLDSGEILERTRGSVLWGLFYGVFVIAVAIHAAIGIRVICAEWLRVRAAWLDAIATIVALILFVMGGYAVVAVTLP